MKRRHFTIRGKNVAHLHAQHFQDGVRRRHDLHFLDLRVHIGELGQRLLDPGAGGRDIFLLIASRQLSATILQPRARSSECNLWG